MTQHGGMKATILHFWHLIIKEAAKFGIIGAIAFVVDNGAYAFFMYGLPGPENGPLFGHVKMASAAATAVATIVSWLGNRYWTFRHKRNADKGRELVLFVFFNVIGLLITIGCVMFTRDVLDLHSLSWDTIARNVGIVLGTLFRFWTYRRYVFVTELDEEFGKDDELLEAKARSTVSVTVAATPVSVTPAVQISSAADRNSANTAG